MSKVITFSTKFPSYHPKAGQPTYFVEKFISSLDIMNGGIRFDISQQVSGFFDSNQYLKCKPKWHTIRKGNRWKVGDKFSPRIWGTDINPKSGRSGAYHSKQIILSPDVEIKKTWDFKINGGEFMINDKIYGGESEAPFELLELIAENDGLDRHDLMAWFKYPKPFYGQIICWDESINY